MKVELKDDALFHEMVVKVSWDNLERLKEVAGERGVPAKIALSLLLDEALS